MVFDGVSVLNAKVVAPDLPANALQTFWGERQFDLSRGLDFNRTAVQGPILACVRHLDHLDFQYQFTVVNFLGCLFILYSLNLIKIFFLFSGKSSCKKSNV